MSDEYPLPPEVERYLDAKRRRRAPGGKLIEVYCDRSKRGRHERTHIADLNLITAGADAVVLVYPDREVGQTLAGDRVLPAAPSPAAQMDAQTRARRSLRCPCGNYVPARDEKLPPIVEVLRRHGVTEISIDALRSRLRS